MCQPGSPSHSGAAPRAPALASDGRARRRSPRKRLDRRSAVLVIEFARRRIIALLAHPPSVDRRTVPQRAGGWRPCRQASQTTHNSEPRLMRTGPRARVSRQHKSTTTAVGNQTANPARASMHPPTADVKPGFQDKRLCDSSVRAIHGARNFRGSHDLGGNISDLFGSQSRYQTARPRFAISLH